MAEQPESGGIVPSDFLNFLLEVVTLRLVNETTRISGRVETIDLQGGVILLRHRDGRYTLVKASQVAIISVVPKRKDGNFLKNPDGISI